ncbi:MAG: VIT domain-containing protein [Planctomycetaceae bacterium]
MTIENTDNKPEPDEQRLAAIMRTIDVDAPAPDVAILESLRLRAAAAFEESPVPVQSGHPENTRPAVVKESRRSGKDKRRKPMIMLLATRGFAGIVAVVSAVVLWLTATHNSSALSTTPFSSVLSELRSASSLQLKVSKEGQSADVWVRAPGLLRREESPQRYQIAAGSRLWKIDEAENTAIESDSPWFLGPQQQIDLIGLLDLGVSDASKLLDARPVAQATRGGRDCLVYRVALPTGNGNLEIEASADAKSLQLVEILAWKSGTKRTGPPLAEMRLVSMNVQVADEKFAVTKSLTEDGRIGKISEAQGIVVLRPMLAKRWTPICRETLLRPGDWIRTELRGANAVKVTLSSDVGLTLGPGTLLECISPTEARLHTGTIQTVSPKLSTVEEAWRFSLLGPRTEKRFIDIGKKLLVRVDRDEKLVDIAETPPWLAGFEGTSNNESLGSLIVTLPDGRNEPLTVGYHKVSVEIRDQIARTTIEESFVNHTLGRLEGVFHFPLPQDASISGFGMWIGNDLIEADVVEKQRAREIYETILREKRDPGLLEWTGGNIFKARVFPIEAHSEKRIKIVYTQVLPLRASRYRYSYGLRSELLRTTPLRELSLTVTVNSALALKSVTCPTHTARIATSGERLGVSPPSATGTERTRRADALPLAFHSAQVEFSAQEYAPTRDFEVVCEIDGRQSDVVVVPHQRGDDGYFLLQLTPPGTDGKWQREILPDGDPLQIVLLCDTSMSMDSEKRREESEFVAAILASLGPDDHFQLVAADVATAWASAEPMTTSGDNNAAATKFLSDRVSLGWTNLDRAFADVISKAAANAHIVYIGDGIISAGDTDPAAFVKRLQQLASGGRQPSGTPRSPGNFTLHAVTVGNANDSVVMGGIATVGGGSARSISGEQTPQIAALELLNEIAQPGLRDLNVEFRGLKVAAVYPERLPNVAAGTQQILVGRYLPEGADQQGEIIVTGKRGSEVVRYAAKVNLKGAEEGNSFIPRLWARAHLDQLLAQGGSQAVQDDIIRLSEEFHIITPYTSLLVLETDADRERFGVHRRYEMRDGERYFADGRDNANFELLQQQMKRAGDWRLGMRRQILGQLAGLGRDAAVFQQHVQRLEQLQSLSLSRGAYPMSGTRSAGGSLGDDYFSMLDGGSLTSGFGGGGGGFGGGLGLNDSLNEMDFNMPMDDRSPNEFSSSNFLGRQELEKKLEESGESDRKDSFEKLAVDEDLLVGLQDKRESFERRKSDSSAFESLGDEGDYGLDGLFDGRISVKAKAANTRGLSLYAERAPGHYERGYNQPDYTSWISSLFPTLSRAPAIKASEPVKDPERWSPEAIALAKSLLRTESLQALDGGIEMLRDTEHLDPRWNRSSGRSIDQVLYSPTAWLTQGSNIGEQTLVNYCDANERSVYSRAFRLGRSRAAVASELKSPPLSLNDFSLSPLQHMYASWNVAIEPAGDNQVRLILTMKDTANSVRFTIDTARHVLLKHEVLNDGRVQNTTSFEDFVELAGTWWARRIVLTNNQGQVLSDTQLNLQALTKDEYAQQLQQLLADKASVQFVQEPFVRLKVARQKVADATATFDDRLAMVLHNAQIQQWDEMWRHVDAAEQLAADKPGVRWIRTVLLATIRRNEEARQRLIEEAQRLAPNAIPDEVFLAEFILQHANTVSETPEFYHVHQLLKPVYARPLAVKVPTIPTRWPDDNAAEQRIREAMSQRVQEIWNEREASSQERMGHSEDVLKLRRAIAESMPWNVYAQQDYANRLEAVGQPHEALVWLQQELARPERSPYDDDVLRTAVADLYRKQGKWDDLQQWTTEWIARNPETTSYYSAYAHHLAAMVFNDQIDAAYALADQWLQEGRVEGKMSTLQQLRFDSALNFANGQAPNLNIQRVDERWFEPLAETARFFVRHPHHFDIVSRCTSNSYFAQSDVVDQLRGEWLTMLRNEGATLSAAQWSSLVGWTLSGRLELTEPIDDRKQLEANEVPDSVWEQIAATLKQRWLQTEDRDQKRLLSEALVTVYSSRFRETKLLPFLRERIAAAVDSDKPAYTAVLFENLLTTAWTHEIETEACTVLQQLSVAADTSEQLTVELPALYRLVDAMLANRVASGEKLLHDQGGLDKLTRKELAEKKSEIRKTALTELSVRLAELARGSDEPMTAWFRIEQFWLDVQLGQNLVEAESGCWRILGDAPPKLKDDAESDDSDLVIEDISLLASEQRKEFFEMQLKRRAFATVMNLAVRSKAPAESVDRLLKYVDAGIGNGGDTASPWRQVKFRLLIALDRADDLERELREWIRVDVSTASWRQMLARLLAERGKLDEAIALFEACEKDKLLTASDYRLLSDWYLVSNRRDAYERSRVESFKQMPEQSLQQMLYQTQNRWSRSDIPLPSELNEDTLFALRALFEKSASPESYFYQVQALYGACRDFRLLQMVPDAMLGRSPQQVYSFLQGLQNYVLGEIRNEATADEILVRVNQLRQGERTATDLRALDLLEAFIERKSSELLNQPGPHLNSCLAAMQKAFQREWGNGEPRMMATFLFQLGALPNETLKAEQLRELLELRNTAAALSRDHLSITMDLCQLLFFSYGERDEALRQMEIEVRDYTQANNGLWPYADNEILSRYVTLLEAANRHAAGEQLLQRFIAQPANTEQTKWLKDRMMSLYNHALEHDGAVSIGTGRANLFAPIVALSLAELDAAPDENVRYTLVTRLTGTFDTAHRHQLAGTKEAVQKFAFETLPAVLKRQQQQYRSTATHPLQLIRDVLDAMMTLQYVVERMEQYSRRLETHYDNSWNAFGYELSARRAHAGSTDLDARILKLTIARLEYYLRTGESNHFQIFYNGYDEFWKEKAAEFAATAERVLNERRSSGRRAMTVAQYFRNGLSMAPRAIEILQIAHGAGILNESEQYTLVTWLRETNRFAEMIPILEPLVKHHPDSMQYRIDLMAAYFHTKRLEQLQTLIAQTIAHFHEGGRWTEGNVGMLANGFIGVNDWKRAQQYFTEAIALHQRANPGSGLNDNTLSQYYQNLASAESALGNTKEAVTAAMSSIVCWDARHEYRTYALNALRSAVNASKDLDAFVAQLDAEAAQSGQDNPILRKAIGQTYQSRNEHRKAIGQFNLALELQPNDKEIHQALIVCYDAVEDKAAASSQLLHLIDLQQHDLTLYQQLATRMSDNPAEAERASTSIIESSPNVAESHAAMAELRQTQDRWAEAIPHWEQVARYRKLEPTGLLKLVEAQIHEQQFAEAKQTLQTLKRTAWPSRFGDVESQSRQLEEKVPKP